MIKTRAQELRMVQGRGRIEIRICLIFYWVMEFGSLELRIRFRQVRRRARTCAIIKQIRRRRWRWIGHLLLMNNQQNPRIRPNLDTRGKEDHRGGGRKVTWKRTVVAERRKVSPPGAKLLLLQETEQVGGDKAMALFSQRRARK